MSSQQETTCSAPPDRSPADAEPVQGASNELQELRHAPNSQKEAADSHADVRPAAPPRQVSSSSSTPPRPTAFKVPMQLIKPGLELLKVSAKSARRVKPRKVWLETMSDKDRDGGNLGLELDLGGVSKQEVKLCWEKNGAGLGKLPPKLASPACPFFARLTLMIVPRRLRTLRQLRVGAVVTHSRYAFQLGRVAVPDFVASAALRRASLGNDHLRRPAAFQFPRVRDGRACVQTRSLHRRDGRGYLAAPQNARELPRRTTRARDLRDERRTDVVTAALRRRGRRQGCSGSRGAPALC